MDFRNDITSLNEMHRSILAGERYQRINHEIFAELVERLIDLESTVSKLTELALPRIHKQRGETE